MASPNSRARPKSAILSSPVEAMSKLLGFKSLEVVSSGLALIYQIAENTYTMQDPVSVNVLESTERHGCPRLDVGGLEDEALVANDGLEVGVEELEHEVDILLDREDVEQLDCQLGTSMPAHSNDVGMV